MKIVINDGYGCFDLSEQAVAEYAQRKGLTLYLWRTDTDKFYYTKPKKDRSGPKDGEWPLTRISRADPILVEIVIKLGAKADTIYSRLAIVEVDNNRNWCIVEDDGKEYIHYE
jgi:hypothetical protein